MKTILTSMVLMMTTTSFAAPASAPKCPAESKRLYACKSTPKAGDNEFAGNVLKSLSICQKGEETLMVMKDSANETGVALVQVSNRVGGVSYSAVQDTVEFAISIAQAVTPTPAKTQQAKFTVTYHEANLSASSTYTCK